MIGCRPGDRVKGGGQVRFRARINMSRVAVAHNGTVLRKHELVGVMRSEGDELEIARAVGGG